MRRAVQLFFLTAFSLLFFLNPYGERLPVPADIFLRLDPLLAGITCVSSRQLHVNLLIALVVLASALIAGRIFCGYLCPLGTLFDLAGRRTAHQKQYAFKNGKYGLLLLLIVCSLFGLQLSGLVDPIALLTRIYAFLLHPLLIIAGNTGIDALRPLADRLDLLYLSHAHLSQPVYAWLGLTVLIAAFLFIANFFAHRFWCRYLCPLGGLLGLFSRRAFFKRQVNEHCTRCMQCVRECPVAAIDERPEKTYGPECIACHTCSRLCPQHAITFTPAGNAPRNNQGIQVTRRTLLWSAGAGIGTAFSLQLSPDKKIARTRLIRPPGAVPEDVFLKQCVRCGECMKACPTNTLQPCLFESGIDGLWSPRLLPRLAGCDQTCSLCGAVCPTDAIRELPLEEKKHAKLGTAYIDTSRCLVWAQDRLCLICDEQCPYNAIVFKWKDGTRKPFVIDVRCNGCGFCEQQCPVQGESAIIVTSHGEIRLAQGSYTEKAKEMQLELREDKGDDGFLLQEDIKKQQARENPKLPEGFDKK